MATEELEKILDKEKIKKEKLKRDQIRKERMSQDFVATIKNHKIEEHVKPISDKYINSILGKDNDDKMQGKNRENDNTYVDLLTKLPNFNSLKKTFLRYERMWNTGHYINMLIVLGIDNFSLINNSLGHVGGDSYLKHIAKRLTRLVKSGEIDLYRYSGDQFIFHVCGLETEEQVKEFLNQIPKVIGQPMEEDIEDIAEAIDPEESVSNTTASMGVVILDQEGDGITEILRKAEIAMYKAKELGKNTYQIYNPSFSDDFMKQVTIQKSLLTALPNNEFILYYQPKVELETMEVTGFEALIRWNNRELGMISPLEFISVAENTGVIVSIGEWVLRQACIFIKELNEHTGVKRHISVNVSVVQLTQNNFVQTVKDTLRDVGLEPECLELEITESVLIRSISLIVEKLTNIKAYGVRIALDDFGKEYSSLSYLKILPIDTMKIDKAFIDDVEDINTEDALTDTIISIGHRMGMYVIAEGVEQLGQLEYLKLHGCDQVQGYIMSRPVPGECIINTINEIENKKIELK